MATNPSRARSYVTFKIGDDTYQIQMANSRTQGTLFGAMGFTNKNNTPDETALDLSLQDALANGLLVKLTASGRIGTKSASRTIYVPTPKIEETFKTGKGKTIGTFKVSKIRSVRKRSYS
jgi:hypothetical protein